MCRPIINLLIDSAPFAASLTRQPTNRSTVAWPTAWPSNAAWLGELQPFPEANLGDDAYVVGVAKLGQVLDLSNESWSDAQINLTSELATLLRDSLSSDLDLGLLHGRAPEPIGVVGVAAEAAGVGPAGGGHRGDAGRSAIRAAVPSRSRGPPPGSRRPTPAATTTASSSTPTGSPPRSGSPPWWCRSSPRRCCTTRAGASSWCGTTWPWTCRRDWHFHLDATGMRIKGRFAAAIPDPNKAIRKLSVTGPAGAQAAGGHRSGKAA